MSVVVVGVNQRTSSLDLLERLSVGEGDQPKVLRNLLDRPNISEVVVLSTCMRTEIYALVERFHGGVADVQDFLAEFAGSSLGAFEDHLYCYYEQAAVAHLFEVACGLDSAVLGETEILSQVRHGWEQAMEENAAGPVLSGLFRQAVEVGKRARSETAVSRGITSVSQAAVALVAQRLEGGGREAYELRAGSPPRAGRNRRGKKAADAAGGEASEGRHILVIGAGEMGEGMATALAASAWAGDVLVANRTWSRAVELAALVGGRPVEIDRLGQSLAEVDVVLASAASPSVILEAGDLEPVLRSRHGRSLLVVDIGVPRNVERSVADLEGVTLLDMDDIRSFAETGMAGRRNEVAKVREIIHEELDRYVSLAAAREAAPLVAALHEKAEGTRLSELERFRARLDALEPRQREAVEALTRGLLGKLLHEPTVRLKEAAGTPKGERLAEALRALFDL